MRALYYVLAAAVLFYAVCQSADLAERLAVRRDVAPAVGSSPAAPELKPSEWRSAPADSSAMTAGRGKGVLVDKATGKRYETP